MLAGGLKSSTALAATVASMAKATAPAAGLRAYEWTKARILDGTFPSGDMISEVSVSEALGVSRTPVREAFQRLQSEGTLELYPKRGALIKPITPRDMRDVMEARLLIEPWAAAAVARLHNRSELLEVVEHHVEVVESAQLPNDAVQFQEADRSLHEAIVAATENALVARFYESLRYRQLRLGAMVLTRVRGRSQEIHREHREILEAIRSGDATGAAQAVHRHVVGTRDALGLDSEPRIVPMPDVGDDERDDGTE